MTSSYLAVIDRYEDVVNKFAEEQAKLLNAELLRDYPEVTQRELALTRIHQIASAGFTFYTGLSCDNVRNILQPGLDLDPLRRITRITVQELTYLKEAAKELLDTDDDTTSREMRLRWEQVSEGRLPAFVTIVP